MQSGDYIDLDSISVWSSQRCLLGGVVRWEERTAKRIWNWTRNCLSVWHKKSPEAWGEEVIRQWAGIADRPLKVPLCQATLSFRGGRADDKPLGRSLVGLFPTSNHTGNLSLFCFGKWKKKKNKPQTNSNTGMNGSVAGWRAKLWCSSISISWPGGTLSNGSH